MGINRRDLLKLAGGSAAGLVFTPVPWKLLDDSAIWSQNWSWTPRLPRGEVTTRYTSCALCPAACGVRATCVGGRPFSVAGVAGHPSGHGALCAAGLGGHSLAYGEGRIRRVLYRGQPAGLDQALAAIRRARGAVAILDERPGRAISEAYRSVVKAVPGAMYLTPPPRENGTFEALRRLVESPPPAFGLDLERTKTLLSFGAAVLDGWISPGRAWAARAGLRLIQAEPRESRTASAADLWLPIAPGSEAALALGIAHVILRDGLAHVEASRADGFAEYRSAVERFTPQAAAAATGLTAARIVEAAREFASGAPAVAIGGGDPGGGPLGDAAELAIAGLNVLCGSVGRSGGIVARRDPHPLSGPSVATAADGSIGALIIDAAPSGNATAWPVIRRKLAPGAVVVAMSAFAHPQADYLIPAPAYLESLQDLPTPFDAARAMFSISPALLAPAPGVVEPAVFVGKLAAMYGGVEAGSNEELIRRRAAAIHSLGRGSVFSYASGETTPLPETAEQFWAALTEGASWVDDEAAKAPPKEFRLLAAEEDGVKLTDNRPFALVPSGWRGAAAGGVSPMMTKLTQESGLRRTANEIAIHPDTAHAAGLEDGCLALVETSCGGCRARIRIASSVRPGVLEASVGPGRSGLLDICRGEDCTWRAVPAGIRRA